MTRSIPVSNLASRQLRLRHRRDGPGHLEPPRKLGSPMHADDTNYTIIKSGVVISGTAPAIRVDGNRLVIRVGPLGHRLINASRYWLRRV